MLEPKPTSPFQAVTLFMNDESLNNKPVSTDTINDIAGADVIFANAHAITFDPAHPNADTVAVRGDTIIFVGKEADSVALRTPNTRVIDCQQKTLLPGLIDSHFHLFAGSSITSGADLRGIKSLEHVRQTIHHHAEAHPEDTWVTGYAAGYSLPTPDEPLTRHHLDGIIANRPLAIVAHDIHAVWLNTLALEKTGLLGGSDDADLSADMTFLADGTASGEIVEGGVFVIAMQHLASDDAFMARAIKGTLAQLASFGITSVHNMLGDERQGQVYRMLEQSRDLTARVYLPYHVTPKTPLEALQEEAVALRETYVSNQLRAGAVKFFADGVYDGKTALTLRGYPDEPANLGVSIFEREQYLSLVAEADRLGLQVATHAVGDGAVRLALEAYEHAQNKNGKRDSRHRIEHIEVIDPADIPRFAQLGVIASMQPLHAPSSPADADMWFRHVHRDQWGQAFPMRHLRDTGAHVVLGSDWAVVTMNPFVSWQAALTRQPWSDEGEGHFKQTLQEILAGYTCDAAYAEFQEDHKGRLKAGMLADITLLSKDVEHMPIDQLDTLGAELTMVGGEMVYAA